MRLLVCSKARAALLVTLALLLATAAADAKRRGRKYKPPPPTATIKVQVVGSRDGKPISGAAVIFHPIRNNKDEGSLELKSDTNGEVKIDVIPIGDTLRLQVIAKGWNTYGHDYKIDSDNKEFVVKLQRPGAQYSLYENKDQAPPKQNVTPKGESTSAKPNGQVPIPQ